jgi:predicted GNAT family acetyltransferase
MSAVTVPEVRHNVEARRFETTIEGELARADYRQRDDVMRLVHTEVPPRFEGRGIASALVRAALEHARSHGLRVEPACSYVLSYMRRHPETHDLLAPGIDLR